MPEPAINEITTLHYLEWIVMNDETFMGTIEAAMRAVAVAVYSEPADTPGHDRRAQIALNIALSDVGVGEARRFRNIFALVALQHPMLRGQFFDTADPGSTTRPLRDRIKPWAMDPLLLDSTIVNAWDVAAGVRDQEE